jgi:hypothetical protein
LTHLFSSEVIVAAQKKNTNRKVAGRERAGTAQPAKRTVRAPHRAKKTAARVTPRAAARVRPARRTAAAAAFAKRHARHPLRRISRSARAGQGAGNFSGLQFRKGKGPAAFPAGATSSKGPKYFFSTHIPDKYNETYLRALPRDPLWLFAYWELSGETVELLRRHVGGDAFARSKWVLRVLDVTDVVYNGSNAWRQTDVELAPHASSWYVKVWEPGRSYLLQVGIVTPDGRFFSAVNSNAAQMPRNAVSAVLDEEWTTASTDELIRLSGSQSGRLLGASENSSGSSASGSGSGSGSMS